ncbi:MAG: ribonuclease P protein component [Alistipes sp.]|nr:ribonuclease P protein component [Alistipes sp.]
MPNYTLPRSERLRSLKVIRRMFGEGRGGFVYPYRYIWIADKQEGVAEGRGIEVMFSVPKKFHKRANKRNLLKRRTREAYRLNREELCERISQAGVEVNLAFIYSTKEVHSYKTIENAVQKILAQVCERL